ncbi:MAG: glycosyltransferase family 2 protein [Chitinophagales bacterium]
MKINVIIPVFNESGSIGSVLRDIPLGISEEVIVVNNGSTDNTAQIAKEGGATVLLETTRGYGSACLRGIMYIKQKPAENQPDVVVFLDGDYSDYPGQMNEIVKPIEEGGYDMVIGSRSKGNRAVGSMQPQQVFGNWLATTLMKLFVGAKFSDLGPFRAIRWQKLLELEMKDTNYGWTVEMQIKAAKKKLKYIEVPVDYRKRIGKSKITGTIKGTIMAGYKILITIFRYI